MLALLGANGAGKTTALRSILGLTRPRRGRHPASTAQSLEARQTHEIARAGIGWVPDDRRLCPTLTVAKNLALGEKRTALPRLVDERRSTEIFSPLKYLMAREAETLSGGEMQMVAIARALLGSPGLVLFDEPSQGLAPKIVDDVLAAIRRLKARGHRLDRGRAECRDRAVGRRPRGRAAHGHGRLDGRGATHCKADRSA